MIEASPAAAVKRPAKETKRDRFCRRGNPRNLGGVRRARGVRARVSSHARDRTASIRSRRDDVERDRPRTRPLDLSRERTKADRAHEVALSKLALAIIDDCPRIGAFVFSTGKSARGTARGPAAPVAISGWSKAKAALDKLALVKARELAEERGEEAPTGLAEWRLHDLRRSAATNLARLGVDRVVIGKVLNHAESEVTAVYDRHRYDGEKKQALEKWGHRLAAIVDGLNDDNVVSLAAARTL